MSNNLKILPIKPDDKRKPYKTPPEEPLPQNCCRMAFIGLTNSGKTVCLNNILLRFMKDCFESIYIISPTIVNDESSRFLVEKAGEENCFENYSDRIVETIMDIQKEHLKITGEMPHIAVVVDDFITEVKQNAKIFGLFTKARHYNISLFICSQVLRALPLIARSQMSHICYFRNPNEKELEKFIEETLINFTGNKKKAYDIYKEATNTPYNFLFLDMKNMKLYQNFEKLLFSKYKEDGTYNI